MKAHPNFRVIKTGSTAGSYTWPMSDCRLKAKRCLREGYSRDEVIEELTVTGCSERTIQRVLRCFDREETR